MEKEEWKGNEGHDWAVRKEESSERQSPDMKVEGGETKKIDNLSESTNKLLRGILQHLASEQEELRDHLGRVEKGEGGDKESVTLISRQILESRAFCSKSQDVCCGCDGSSRFQFMGSVQTEKQLSESVFVLTRLSYTKKGDGMVKAVNMWLVVRCCGRERNGTGHEGRNEVR